MMSRAKVVAAERQEAARQALMRSEATPQTLAYARFLVAVANDATINGGGFNADDADVAREYPFLRPLIEGQSK